MLNIGTLWEIDQKYLEICETFCWRVLEKTSWTDRVTNEDIPRRQGGDDYPKGIKNKES